MRHSPDSEGGWLYRHVGIWAYRQDIHQRQRMRPYRRSESEAEWIKRFPERAWVRETESLWSDRKTGEEKDGEKRIKSIKSIKRER